MAIVEGTITANPPAPHSVIENFIASGGTGASACFPCVLGGGGAKIVNEETHLCVGGLDSEECYVAEINLGDLRDEVVSFSLSSGGYLVLGSVCPEEYDLGNFVFLTAVGARYGSGGQFVVDRPGSGFVRLVDNGHCIMMPFFSTEQ